MKSPIELLNKAMRDTGQWHGPNGSKNHAAYDVLFAAEQHLRRDVDTRARLWLAGRQGGSSVEWLRNYSA